MAKNHSLAVLVIVAVIGVASLIVLFNAAPTAQVPIKMGQKFYGAEGMAYFQETMNCETLIAYKRVPVGMDYEASPSDAIHRFGMDKCVDVRDLIGVYCCNPVDLY